MESSLLGKYRNFRDVKCCPRLLETSSKAKESSILKALTPADPVQVLWSNSDSPKYYSEWCQFYPMLQGNSKAPLFELHIWSPGCIKPLKKALKLHIHKSSRWNKEQHERRGKEKSSTKWKKTLEFASPENGVCQVGIKCWCSQICSFRAQAVQAP